MAGRIQVIPKRTIILVVKSIYSPTSSSINSAPISNRDRKEGQFGGRGQGACELLVEKNSNVEKRMTYPAKGETSPKAASIPFHFTAIIVLTSRAVQSQVIMVVTSNPVNRRNSVIRMIS